MAPAILLLSKTILLQSKNRVEVQHTPCICARLDGCPLSRCSLPLS